MATQIPWVATDQAQLRLLLVAGKPGDETPIDLSDATSIECHLLNEDGEVYKTLTAHKGDESGQPISIDMIGIDTPGRYEMRFTINGPANNRITVPSPSRLTLAVRA